MPILKLCIFGDPHNREENITASPVNTQAGLNATPWMQDTFDSMASRGFIPDLVGSVGDNSTASSVAVKTSLLVEVLDKLTLAPGQKFTVLGNHDFEYATPDEVQTVVNAYFPYFVPGQLYGAFDYGNWHIVILDANYYDYSPYNHFSALGLPSFAHGYVPQSELDWLTADLAATSKKTLVFVHQTVGEFDSSFFYVAPSSDVNRYSITNRAAVRSVLEASGKVVAVVEGHQHITRWSVQNGIAYMVAPSLVGLHPTPTRPLGGDKGIWSELTIDDAAESITIDIYENDSIAGVRHATSHSIQYGANSPHKTNVYYNTGEMYRWTGVTNYADGVPVDIWLSNNLLNNPLPNGLLVKGGSTGNSGYATHPLPPQVGQFDFLFTVNKAEADKVIGFALHGGSVLAAQLVFDATGTIKANDLPMQAYSIGQTYELGIKVDVESNSFDVFVAGELVLKSVAFANAISIVNTFRIDCPAGSNATCYLEAFTLGASGTLLVPGTIIHHIKHPNGLPAGIAKKLDGSAAGTIKKYVNGSWQ